MRTIINYFKDWNLFERVWLFLFTSIVIVLSLYWKDSLIGIICSLTGIWCVILVAKGRISNYIVGTVNVLLYVIISYSQKYYGEVMLNALYFLPMQFIGFYLWNKNKDLKRKGTVKIKLMTNKHRIITSVLSISIFIIYGYFLQSLGGSLPFIDSMSTIFSIVAMLLMVYGFVEQWVLWIIVDVVTIILWATVLINGGTDVSVLVMWVAYLFNAMYGLFNWVKLYKVQEV